MNSSPQLGVWAARVTGLLGILCASLGSSARADSPTVLVIAANASADASVTKAVRDAVADLERTRLLPAPPLDLESAQLAIDCTDDSARCMSEIAERMEADVVIVPSLKKRADSVELHLKCFQRRSSERLTTAMRKQAGTRLDASLLAAVPGMVREVLELPAAIEHAPPAQAEALPHEQAPRSPVAEDLADEDAPEPQTGSLIGPLMLGGGGVALVAAGVVFGAMASASEDDYASRDIDTEEQAERAHAVRQTGESQALAANVLLATGAAALIAAGVWYLLDGPDESAPAARLSPVIGPRSAGLVLTGSWKWQP